MLKYDKGKLQYDLVPPVFISSVARVLTWAVEREVNPYKPNSWKKVKNAKARYTSALMRHLEAWRDEEEEDYDKESRFHHLAHVATNALILLWYELKTKPFRKEVENGEDTDL
jgi:hypothetical protein